MPQYSYFNPGTNWGVVFDNSNWGAPTSGSYATSYNPLRQAAEYTREGTGEISTAEERADAPSIAHGLGYGKTAGTIAGNSASYALSRAGLPEIAAIGGPMAGTYVSEDRWSPANTAFNAGLRMAGSKLFGGPFAAVNLGLGLFGVNPADEIGKLLGWKGIMSEKGALKMYQEEQRRAMMEEIARDPSLSSDPETLAAMREAFGEDYGTQSFGEPNEDGSYSATPYADDEDSPGFGNYQRAEREAMEAANSSEDNGGSGSSSTSGSRYHEARDKETEGPEDDDDDDDDDSGYSVGGLVRYLRSQGC